MELSFSIVLNGVILFVLLGGGVYLFLTMKKVNALYEENKQNQFIAKLHEFNPNPIMQCDVSGRLIYANEAANVILSEWTVELGELLPEDKIAIIEDALESQSMQEIDQRCGEEIYVIKFSPNINQKTVSIFGLNITERVQVEKELMQLTVYDQATDLPNKTLFLDRVNREIEQSKKENRTFPLFVIFMVDQKEIVDAFGQEIGDKLLQAASHRFQQHISLDATLGRVGDSEFGLLEKNLSDPGDVANFAQEFYDRSNLPFEIDGKVVVCEIRVGIAMFPTSGKTGEELAQNSTIAANRAQNDQIPFEFYQKGMNQQIEARRTIVGEMHHALENNQFVLFYQPQVMTQTGRVVGAEALLRWFHPEKGQIPPYAFIPTAEESGIIIPISEWVLFEACSQIAKWTAMGLDMLKISVNVTSKQFAQTDLVAKVKQAIEATGISPHQLELELTEGLIIKDIEKTIETMGRLRELGVSLALDDFGTGYSSLSYLKRFPIQKLKVDRAFIKDITDANDDTEITMGIIQLGHSLKMKVITEGVETDPQLEYVKKHNCDMIQGFYFSKPLPPEEFEQFVRKNLSETKE